MTALITISDVLEAQSHWADSVVSIGSLYASGGDYRGRAEKFVSLLYGHDIGDVFFKPTVARAVPFRRDFAETLSYFIGGIIDEDRGFALRPWASIRFGSDNMIYCGDSFALSQGRYFMCEAGSEELEAHFSFVYVRNSVGDLKIVLHHSSWPVGDN